MHLCLGRRAPPPIGRGDPRPRPAFRSCLAPPPEARRPGKRVVFADTKGLSLTSVHSFEDAVGADSDKDFRGGSRGARPAPPSSPKQRPSVPGRPAPGRTPGSPEASADPAEARGSARGRGPPARRRAGSRARFPEGAARAHRPGCLGLPP
ncbi:translation initiation factor IF-2-like [Moschus berezovskii]|uniref:translation initiation factor IF-2-like n=1 Tax=Moschus berezovskii TaxID=68408 RepID=UPI0024442628|nr:translation initiation factor IF-2-like [Moschus berezovskii]XP_055272255.1 translation initiation factor IF-2-like [Moschus berezovskii]